MGFSFDYQDSNAALKSDNYCIDEMKIIPIFLRIHGYFEDKKEVQKIGFLF